MKKIITIIATLLISLSLYAEVTHKSVQESKAYTETWTYNDVLFSCLNTCYCPDDVPECTGNCTCPYPSHKDHSARAYAEMTIEMMAALPGWHISNYETVKKLPKNYQQYSDSNTELIIYDKNVKPGFENEFCCNGLVYYIKDGNKWLYLEWYKDWK